MSILPKFLWPLVLVLCCDAAESMTIEVHGARVFATGPVDDDYAQFARALERPEVDTVVLVNSPGGDLSTGLRVGRLIADKGLKTVAAGFCMSSCSIMFMGGRERRFADAFRPASNVIGIHGAHDRVSNQVNPNLQPAIYAFYKRMIGENFNGDLVNQALYKIKDAGGFLRIPEATRNPNAVPFLCLERQTPRRDCTDYAGQSGVTLGVLTDADLVQVDLPKAFAIVPRVFGQVPDVPVDDLDGFISSVVQPRCRTENCAGLLADWRVQPEHRSIAQRLDGNGIGLSWNRDSQANAVLGATYACNHPRNRPIGLCEASIVNSFDLRALFQVASESHGQALEALTPPPDSFYGNEEFGGWFTRANEYRTQKFIDMTPQGLAGIRTIGTQALARMLKSESAPMLIDVSDGGADTIPSSQSLFRGGAAFEDAAKDGEFEGRFVGLLKLLAPDGERPVVFYCASRNCWLAVNAALRARKNGYQDVLWYRGGVESWRAARLPTALVAIRAVANN